MLEDRGVLSSENEKVLTDGPDEREGRLGSDLPPDDTGSPDEEADL